eukprot:TRINITY_DN67090_c0_g1_i1.p1 TRINITY_DN67090_c0_g1~~TRINITY_DN67090_c0_g1_i1.p1  ORF type:complete len:168 (-),score=59.84 TRINITY_DN67090_c0_g1_i1:204-707(-)
MSFITNGLDTSKVYKRTQPPGGKCSDLFGNHEEPVEVEKSQTSNKENGQPAAENNGVAEKEQVAEKTAVAEKIPVAEKAPAAEKVPAAEKEAVAMKEVVAEMETVTLTDSAKKDSKDAPKAVADVKPQERAPAALTAPAASSNSTAASATDDYARNKSNAGRSTAMW